MNKLLDILKYIFIIIVAMLTIVSILITLGINTYDKFGYKVLEAIVEIVGQ